MTLREEMELLCSDARSASRRLALCTTEEKNRILFRIAELIERDGDEIIEDNKIDLAAAEANGVPKTMLDRLSVIINLLNKRKERKCCNIHIIFYLCRTSKTSL